MANSSPLPCWPSACAIRSRETLADFRRLGLPVEVLTGDTAERAAALDLPAARGGMLPDDKRVEPRVAGGKPLFVGDGINDAAALASAHVGRCALERDRPRASARGRDAVPRRPARAAVGRRTEPRGRARGAPEPVSRAGLQPRRHDLAACGVLHPVVAAAADGGVEPVAGLLATRVGVSPDHCANDAETSRERQRPAEVSAQSIPLPARRAVWHGLAFALQGVVFLLLLDSARRCHSRPRYSAGSRSPEECWHTSGALALDPARARHVRRHAHARQPRHAPRLVGR